VEIDENKFGHRKYHHGCKVKETCVYGVEITNKRKNRLIKVDEKKKTRYFKRYGAC